MILCLKKSVPPPLLVDKSHVQECLLEMLTDMFGSEGISKMIRNNMVTVTVDEKIATVNVDSLEVRCDDEELQQVLLTAIKNLYQAIAPVKQAG